MAEHAHTTSGGQPLPLSLIDFATHADAELLGLCNSLVKLRDAQERLEDAIARTEFEIRRTPSRTVDGAKMKGLAI
jgi:hypothetical protein